MLAAKAAQAAQPKAVEAEEETEAEVVSLSAKRMLAGIAGLNRVNRASAVAGGGRVVENPALAPSSTWGLAPGVVGGLAEHILASANQPSEAFATAGALSIVGLLIGRRIAGPSGSGRCTTHGYWAVIGETASGKQHIRGYAKRLLTEIGAQASIGPGRFKSGAGIVAHLQVRPASLCFLDELGAMFAKLADPRASHYEKEINEVLRELWGTNWDRYDSPGGATEHSVGIMAPALSLLGTTTPEELFKACKSRDIANGFLNRWLFVEVKGVPPWREVPPDALDVPATLKNGLAGLYKPLMLPGSTGKPPIVLPWGAGAEEMFLDIRQRCEAEPNEQHRPLLRRSAEKMVRIATTLAAGAGATAVPLAYMELAWAYVASSDATLRNGIDEHMEAEKMKFDELCRWIVRKCREAGGRYNARELGRRVQNHLYNRSNYADAVAFLIETEQLTVEKVKPEGGIGRPSDFLALPTEPSK
jgi:hypothetical protein